MWHCGWEENDLQSPPHCHMLMVQKHRRECLIDWTYVACLRFCEEEGGGEESGSLASYREIRSISQIYTHRESPPNRSLENALQDTGAGQLESRKYLLWVDWVLTTYSSKSPSSLQPEQLHFHQFFQLGFLAKFYMKEGFCSFHTSEKLLWQHQEGWFTTHYQISSSLLPLNKEVGNIRGFVASLTGKGNNAML